MKISELIEVLKTKDQNLAVLVDGYEAGLSDIAKIEEVSVRFHANSESWNGEHEEDEKSIERAIVFRRKNR